MSINYMVLFVACMSKDSGYYQHFLKEVYQSAVTKNHRLGGLNNSNSNLFLTVLEAVKSKIKVSKVGSIMRPLLLACRQLSSPGYVCAGGGVGLGTLVSFFKDQGPTPTTLSNPNYLPKTTAWQGRWGGAVAKASTCELKMPQAHKEASGWLWEGPNPKRFRGELWRGWKW